MIGVLLLLAGPAGAWELVSDNDGVRTFKRDVSGTNLLAFRGEGTVGVHISKVVSLFMDARRGPEWQDLLSEAELLSGSAVGQRSVVYTRYSPGWPISDRDFVIDRNVDVDPADKSVTVWFKSTDHSKRPVDSCCIRGHAKESFWRFKAKGNNATKVELEVETDPRGNLLSWVVNFAQRSWPRKAIRTLETRSAEPDIKPHPQLRDW